MSQNESAALRLDAARQRMREAATARCPVVSADDIHIVLAELASVQAALRDLQAEHAAALDKLVLHDEAQSTIARAVSGEARE